MTTTKAQLNDAIAKVRAQMAESVENGWAPARNTTDPSLVPTVYVGRISSRRWVVGWNYQDESLKSGEAIAACRSDFTEPLVKA